MNTVTEYSEEKHNLNVQGLLKEAHGKVKVAMIDIDQMKKPHADDFSIKTNFPCLRCKSFPVGPVYQCKDCEGMYCAWCTEAVKKGMKEETTADAKKINQE